MVEVFKTNIEDPEEANKLIVLIQGRFDGYAPNFDLEDCDRILRVQSVSGHINAFELIIFLVDHSCVAAVLPEEL